MNLAILLDNLHPSDIVHRVVKATNDYKVNPLDDVSIYIEDVCHPSVDVEVPLMQMIDLFSFYGIVIGTTINNMGHAQYAPNPKRRIYYMSDYEWCRQKYPARVLYGFFNGDVDIITSTELQRDFVQTVWLRDRKEVLGVVPNFDLSKILELIQ